MLVVASLAIEAEDPSTVVATILKTAKLLKIVELHVEIPDTDPDEPIPYTVVNNHPSARLIPVEE